MRGTCERLEKSYFRLTSAPDPGTVRPEARAARVALRRLRSREVAGEIANKYTYHYLNDQLKAIRQDLVVQRLRTPFAVEAYEHHARVALRHGDLGEFNQCQTVLRDLRRDARGGRCDETTTKSARKKTRRSIDDGDAKIVDRATRRQLGGVPGVPRAVRRGDGRDRPGVRRRAGRSRGVPREAPRTRHRKKKKRLRARREAPALRLRGARARGAESTGGVRRVRVVPTAWRGARERGARRNAFRDAFR